MIFIKNSIKALNTLIKIGLILTIITLALFPLVYTAFLKVTYNQYSFDFNKNIVFYIGIFSFYILSIPYLFIIVNLNSIAKQFKNNDFFNVNISKNLKNIAMLFLTIGVFYLVINIVLYYVFNIFLYALTIIPSFIIAFISIVLSLIFFIASEFYLNIINIKDENDLTV